MPFPSVLESLIYRKWTWTCFNLFFQTKGFFNVTTLALMPFFDLAKGLVPDYMHGALLGITKTLMYNWFSSTKAKKQCFIGNEVCTNYSVIYLVKINYQSPSSIKAFNHSQFLLVQFHKL